MVTNVYTKSIPEQFRSEILKIVAIYSVFGGLWIYLSDTFLGLVINDPAVFSMLSTYKGLAFIAITASLLYVLITRYSKRIGIQISELSQSQHMLDRQKVLLDFVVEGTTDAVYLKDAASRYLLANAAVSSFVKKPVAEIVGYDDTHLFPPDEAQTIMAKDQWIMAQSSPQTYEELLSTADGDRYFLSTKGAVRDENGTVTGIFGIARDITDRKQAEEALKRSEEKFYKAFKASPEAIFISSIDDGTYIDVNDVFVEITGFQRDELIGHSAVELGFWIDLNKRQQFLEELSKTGSLKSYEVRNQMRDKTERDFLVSSEIIDIAGKHCSLNFIMDITDRKLAEDALKESEFFFKESQRSANIGSYKADFISNYWKPSEVLCTIFGIDEGYDFSAQGWIDIIHPDDKDMMDQYMREEVISKGKPFSKEYRIVRKNDGETRWVKGLGEATCDSDGNILSLIGTIQDITERKIVEKERQNLERQLLHAQKLESLGVLAGGIAHDFNNILAVIIAYCSMTKLRPERTKENIPLIEKAAERAAELCRQMQAYAGKAQLTQKEVNVGEIVAEMVKMLKTTIQQNVVIKLDRPTNIPPITGDASQIGQIVMNLIINASEAIGDVDGEIRVSIAKAEIRASQSVKDHLDKIIQPGNYICLEVSDNGSGMDAETKQRLFEPFYTTKFTGRGLGMSATLGIVTAHKGAVQLSSQSGKGTTFKVYLPLQMTESSEVRPNQQVTSLSPWQSCGTILLVEDEEPFIEIAKSMLEELGFTVIGASNGKEALKLYKGNASEIKLVVTDIGMPIMDGYALVRELKIIKPELPIIISSGFGDNAVTARIPSEDIAGLISKPYNIDQLREVLKSVVEGVQKNRV
jgi:PAS domain S-box-containing protein